MRFTAEIKIKQKYRSRAAFSSQQPSALFTESMSLHKKKQTLKKRLESPLNIIQKT